jgi:hypothetical protein
MSQSLRLGNQNLKCPQQFAPVPLFHAKGVQIVRLFLTWPDPVANAWIAGFDLASLTYRKITGFSRTSVSRVASISPYGVV